MTGNFFILSVAPVREPFDLNFNLFVSFDVQRIAVSFIVPSRRELVENNFAVNGELRIVNPVREAFRFIFRRAHIQTHEAQNNLPVGSGFGDKLQFSSIRLKYSICPG